MQYITRCYTLCLSLLLTLSFASYADTAPFSERADTQQFINKMADTHDFDTTELEQLFNQVYVQQSVLNAISNPYEAKPWFSYRDLFINAKRINEGVTFWQQNADTLYAAEQEFGVPAEIIVAIIGVETNYGDNQGSHPVFATLATLAFEYPRRADFFERELEQFLLLTRENNLDPLDVYGSYAGAIGKPQFMPSSYRHYAIDYSNSGNIDLRNEVKDAIGSVANYLKTHGWEAQQPITIPAQVSGSAYQQLDHQRLRTKIAFSELDTYNIQPQVNNAYTTEKVNLIELDTADGKEYWVGFNNFYVITRYNISKLYAMAVFQLAEEIREQRQLV